LNLPALILSFSLLLVAMTLHEFAHAWAAYKFGDQTARLSGRLTLNPLAHIDPVGTVIIPLLFFFSTGGRFVFGAAKPVPINYGMLKNPARDVVFIGASGPLVNIAAACASAAVIRLVPQGTLLSLLLAHFLMINLVLGIFNLIPLPPLDGSRVLAGFLPPAAAAGYAKIEPYGFIIIILLSMAGAFDYVIWPLVRFIAGLLI
jgi:Zn-dependent protease